MKKKILHFTAVMMVLMLTLFMLAGCKDGSGSDEDAALSEFVYMPEAVRLPEGIGQILPDGIAISADKVYIAARADAYDEDTVSYGYYSQLYSMNFDGSNFSELQNYTPPGAPRPDASGGSLISSINADSDGNLWIAEQWQFGGYDLPDGFDADSDDPENYDYIEYDSGYALRKLDHTGAELLSVDLSDISDNREDFYIQSFNTDEAGNIYMAVMDHSGGGYIIYVLGNDGKALFQLDASRVDRLIRMPDGRVAFMDSGGTSSRILRTIDIEAKAFGSHIDIPSVGNNAKVYPGNGEFNLLAGDSDNLYGYTIGDNEPVKLLNWLDTGLQLEGMEHVVLLPDGRILCSSNVYDQWTSAFKAEIVLLEAKPLSELPEKPEKTVLSLATLLYTPAIRDLVVEFNQTNPDYHIEVTDYSEGVDASAGLTRLSTEIISGKIPDILDVTHLPYMQYVPKGLLADLYPLIDSDPEMSRSDFVEGALRAAEIDGGVYMAFPYFDIMAVIGNSSVIGTGLDWTLDEFKAVLDAHPDADLPFGGTVTKRYFLQLSISFDIDEYIDWGNGTVNFDTDEFISLLEYANIFSAEFNDSINPVELFSTGRQIMVYQKFQYLSNLQLYKSLFGSEIAIKGFPVKNSSRITLEVSTKLAIAAGSKNKDGAWEFIRLLFDEKRQSAAYAGGFPVNKAAFDALLEKNIYSSNNHQTMIGVGFADGAHYKFPGKPITQEDVEMLMSMIDAAAGINSSYGYMGVELWEIISEEASNFFNGHKSAEEAARVIQSRASIYVSEQSG